MQRTPQWVLSITLLMTLLITLLITLLSLLPARRLPMPRPGQVLGLVGTNGIGKSTALKILAGKLKPNLGRFAEVRSLRVDRHVVYMQWGDGRGGTWAIGLLRMMLCTATFMIINCAFVVVVDDVSTGNTHVRVCVSVCMHSGIHSLLFVCLFVFSLTSTALAIT